MVLRALWTSKTGLAAQQQKLDNISNNLANVNTAGYKRQEVSFQDLVYENIERLGYPTTTDAKTPQINGTGARIGAALRDNTQGSLLSTGMNTDLALDGPGYFRVNKPDGTQAYLRSGSFNVDSLGRLVDKTGNILDIEYTTEGNAINEAGGLSADNFTVDQSGKISVRQGNDIVDYGTINIYNFTGRDALLSAGKNLYVPKDGAELYTEKGTNILQGLLENSNVDIAREMTDMIVAQRSFELNSKGIKTADDMWGLINNMKSR